MKKNIQLICSAYLRIAFVVLVLCCSKSYAAIRYVKPVASGTGDGSNWNNASNDLQAMIIASSSGDDIWVAAGTYKPNRRADATGTITVNDRDNAFVLKNGVRIFGGFIGTETAASQRNFATNICILSGDIGTAGTTTDNCYHVVVCAGTVTGTALNGFFIRYGNANGSGNITVNAVSVGRGSGAGMRISSSSPTISNCVFSANSTTNNGGGMVCDNASPVITNCVFSGNRANDGGALLNTNSSATEIINCTFAGNIASVTGGAVRNGNSSSPVISNSVIWNNWVGLAADAIYNADAGSVPMVNYCVVQGGYTGTGNTNTDPLFVNALSPTFAPTVVGDYRVQKCGPCINAGNNSYVPGSINHDLEYTPRINYGTVDIGAYEMQLSLAVPDANGIVYVDSTKNGNGSSWTNAVKELADALAEARYNPAIQQIWVAKGTYFPKYRFDFETGLCNAVTGLSTFALTEGIKVYGGFAGGEADTTGRNFILNKTILSGDIGASGVNADNCRNVLFISPMSFAYMNGCKITKAFAGSGLVNNAILLVLKECMFSDNISGSLGGAISNQSPCTLSISNCDFLNNSLLSLGQGGAIYNNTGAHIQIDHSRFYGNSAANGAGIHVTDNSGLSKITHCVFSGNESSGLGGALCSHQGIEIANCLFSGNKSDLGGAMHFDGGPNFTVSNCTVVSNTATSNGSAIFGGATAPEIHNSIIYGNAGGVLFTGAPPVIDFSTVQGGYAGTGNISTDPLFINPQLASAAPTTAGDYRLQKCSPAINTGDNASVPPGITKDLDSNNRIAFGLVDMGAYEKHLSKPGTSGVVYVDSSNTAGAGDGSSWSTAVTELADALKEAKTNTDVKEIWVAKGAYKPRYNADDSYLNSICHATDRDASFVLVPDVKLYGGFAGGETDTSARNIIINETILSGDIGVLNDSTDNTYHVLISAGDVGLATLDGITITKGQADGGGFALTVNGFNNFFRHEGGGIISKNSSPTFKKCSFTHCTSLSSGGAMRLVNYSAEVSNCSFYNNSVFDPTSSSGGAISNGGTGNAYFRNCQFLYNKAKAFGGAITDGSTGAFYSGCYIANNEAQSGAGFYAGSTNPVVIQNCLIEKNKGGLGAGIYTKAAKINNTVVSGNTASAYGGGVLNFFGTSSLVNCLIVGNKSGAGGGLTIYGGFPILKNCTVAGNFATIGGGIYYTVDASLTELQNSIVWNNNAPTGAGIFNATTDLSVSNSIIQGGFAGTGNYDIDPLFVSPQSPAAAPTTLGDYRLQPCSPAINMGDNSLIPPGLTKDLDSLDRIKYTTVDMGAYETQTIDLANTTWKGVNTDWNDKINWCGGYIPVDTTNVTVPVTSNNPLINPGYNNEVKNISFANNTSIGIANTSKLTINGTYTNSGSTITNNGTWVMTGTATGQTFPGLAATVGAMKNLEINNPNGIKFDKSFELTGILIPDDGNINVDNATVTLNSDASGTARIEAVPPTVAFSYTGTGKFEIERYIPPHRAWRLLTAPLSTVTNLTISDAWQEGVSNANRLSPVNPAPGFGTTITKSTTYNVADGYDQGSTNNPSIRYYNGTNWGGVPTATNGTTPGANNGLINDKQGYMLFVRGDRGIQVAGTGVTATVTTLRPKGQLKVGPQTINCSGWTVIGNPYASPINFHKIVSDNPGLPDVFYVWDANLAGSSNVGGWVSYGSYNGVSQTYTVAPLLSGSTFANNKGDISSGSAFMVNYTGNITINENHKSTLGDNVLYRPTRQLSMNLYVVNADSTESLNDGVAIVMDASPRAANAEKNTNFTENLAIAFDNKRYAIQNRQRPHFNDTLFIYTGQMKQRSYVLEIKADELNLPNRMKAFLEDTYLHQYKPVALEGGTRYAFAVNADSASSSAARFRLLFKKAPSFKNIMAIAKEKDIEVQWQMEEDFSIMQYQVERSVNGIDFTVAQNTNRHNEQGLQGQWLDVAPTTGDHYYRIKAIGIDGEVLYSDNVKASMSNNITGLYVYPNPVTGNQLQLRMNMQPQGAYSATLTSSNGQKIFTQQWQHSGGFVTRVFELIRAITPGIYQLEVVTASGKKEVLPVEVQR